MDRTKRTLPSLLVLVVFGLVATVSLRAADGPNGKGSWDDLKKLAPGDQIQVVLNDGKSYRGHFQALGDNGIVVRLTAAEQTFARETVLRVSVKGQSHRLRNALIGLATGAGVGVIVGVASPELGQGTCAQGSCVNAESASVAGFVGGALGAGIGAAIPTGGWRDVYRAR